MPIASTKSGKAMIVSVTRPTMRSVQPPKNPAAGAGERADREGQRHRGERDGEVEARGDDDPAQDVAAELVGAEPVRARRRLQRLRGVARERIVGRDRRAEQRRTSDEEQEAARRRRAVTGFSPST